MGVGGRPQIPLLDVVALSLVVGVGACSPVPPTSPARPPSSGEGTEVSPLPSPPAPSTPASSAPALSVVESPRDEVPPAPPSAGVAARCEALCAVTEQRCDELSVRKCRAACAKYVERSGGCEPQYEQALACQARADVSELCAQVASPRCTEEFRALSRCERGEPALAPAAAPSALSTWVAVEDTDHRFSSLLPAGARRDSDGLGWSAVEDGVTHAVRVRPAPRPPLTQSQLVRLVIAYVGVTCQQGLRLFGQYEADGQTALRFSTGCHDGREYQGMLRIWDDLAFAQYAQGSRGATPASTEFFESFRRLPAPAGVAGP